MLCSGHPSLPKWNESHVVMGTLQLPYAEISEPFTGYWDLDHNRSRIDYYGTMVLSIQLGSKSPADYGRSYIVVPITTETLENVKTCFLVNGSSDVPITPQAVLPDLSGFEYRGTEMILGRNTSVWEYVEMHGQKKNKYTMWVDQTGPSVQPIRYEMMGYDTLLGSHYDKYILDYDDYEVGDIPDKMFDIPKDISSPCGDFPGPGAGKRHSASRMLVNPMREYIHGDTTHVDPMFSAFTKDHGRDYRGKREHTKRKHIFHTNLRYIQSINRAGRGYTLAVNHLADRSDEELAVLRGHHHSKGYNGGQPFIPLKKANQVPDTMDWRLYGAVTQVKDQAVCGSCWSFGTTGTLEGTLFLKTGQLVRLSQQSLVDCSWGYGNNGCDGGEDFRVYQWMMKHGGVATEESYGPYLAQDGMCHYKDAELIANITGFVNVTSGDLDALKVAIATKGPISVAIDASHKSLSFYSNGVYFEPDCGNSPDSLDHAVLAVGYGMMNGEGYWLIKNSWSTYWGNDGYVLMSQRDNNCGVATDATYVLME